MKTQQGGAMLRPKAILVVAAILILMVAASPVHAGPVNTPATKPSADGGDITLNGPAIYYYDAEGNEGYVRLHDQEDGFWIFAAYAMDGREVARLIPNEIRALQNGGTQIVEGVFVGTTYYPPPANKRTYTLLYDGANKYRAPPGHFRIPRGETREVFWEPNGHKASNMGFGIYKIADEGCFIGKLRIPCDGAPSQWFMIEVPGGRPWTPRR